jgi:hypothetical protein
MKVLPGLLVDHLMGRAAMESSWLLGLYHCGIGPGSLNRWSIRVPPHSAKED